MTKKYLFVSFVLILISCSVSSDIKSVKIKNITIPVEVELTQAQQEKGLMYRTQLEGGMLFVYSNEAQRNFWMKNTLIPLDIIFIDSDNQITAIKHAKPCVGDFCDIYSSPKAQYVLEVNYDFTSRNNIREGMNISFVRQ